jgi:peptidoglycan/xylan/chitin deacetylase (PgdA/CDA1 family)
MSSRERALQHMKSFFKQAAFLVYLYSGYPWIRNLVLGSLGLAPVVVLCYHRIGERGSMSKTQDEFRRDLEYLRRHYDCITLRALCARLQKNEPSWRPAAVVTFDDGYRDNFTAAVPVLRAARVPATFFVNPGFVGSDRMFPHDNRCLAEAKWRYGFRVDYCKMSWDELQVMQGAGFEIGSHTTNHTDLGKVDQEVIRSEICASLVMLNRVLGSQPRPFAFPWGRPENCPEHAVHEVQRAGYYGAVWGFDELNSPSTNRFRVRRIDAGNGHASRLEFRARIAGFNPAVLSLVFQRPRPARNPRFSEAGPAS